MALTLPFLTCGVAAVMVSKLYMIWPPIRSVRSGPLPLYGTCSASTPACSLNISSARCCAEPWPAEPNVTWPGWALHSGDDVGHGLRLLRRVGDQQVGRDADQHDRHEVALDVVAQLRLQARRQAVAVDVRHQQRRAVARLLRLVFGGEHAGDAGPGLDDDLLVPHRRQLGGDDAGQRVGAAAGRKADDDPHRRVRPFLRQQARRGERGDGGAGGLEKGASLHRVNPRKLARE